MRCYNAGMLWIAAQTFVTIAITVAFAKIVKASLRTSLGLGIFYSGYETALVGVITGQIESCHVGMFVVLCGTVLFLAKLFFSLINHAPVSLPKPPIRCIFCRSKFQWRTDWPHPDSSRVPGRRANVRTERNPAGSTSRPGRSAPKAIRS